MLCCDGRPVTWFDVTADGFASSVCADPYPAAPPSISMSKPARAPKLDPAGTNPICADAHCFDDSGSLENDILHWRHYQVGQTVYGADRFVEYIPGNLPIVITVPHGGYANPGHIPNRIGGVHEPDIHTQELARLLQAAFATALGVPNAQPHMVINRLQRCKLDMNRNEMDASGGNPVTRKSWRQFQAFVRRAKREIVRGRSITNPSAAFPPSSHSAVSYARGFSRGLCVDLHGQSHDRRHQLGYVLSQQELSVLSDSVLDSSQEMIEKCSLRIAIDPAPAAGVSPKAVQALQRACCISGHGVAALNPARALDPTRLSQIIRGSKSLGALLENLGHPCVPSPSSPHAHVGLPPGESLTYFNGGYTTHIHGSGSIGSAQRKKEIAADLAAVMPSPSAGAGSASAASAAADSAAIPLGTPDPDPDFSFLFLTALESECFLSIQAETAYEGHRDSVANMARFARNLAQALCKFVEWHVIKETLGERIPRNEANGEKEVEGQTE